MRLLLSLFLCMFATVILTDSASGQRLFVGLEGSTPPTKSTDLAGFPDVTWATHANVDVSGAAAKADGTLYICNGAFTTLLYEFPTEGTPEYLCTISVDIHGMGYGNGTLYGFSNFTSPRGIYTIDTVTGQATLVVDLDASGFRFFALDVNPADGLLYGYTEYGSPTGLYSIDPESGATTFIAAPIPASNSSARALAIGNDTIYLAATRGDDGVPLYAWDLGTGGPWVPFDNPYPEYHSTGGAAWIPSPSSGIETGSVAEPAGPQIEWVAPNPVLGSAQISWRLAAEGPARLEVIDVAGRFVAQLETGRRGAGSHVTHWDGRGDQGRLLPSGTYFVRLTAESGVSTTPVLLIR